MSEERWDIPSTWIWSPVGDLAEIVGGGTPSTSDDDNFAERGIPWLTPADLTNCRDTYINRGRRNLSEKGYRQSAARLLPAGSVLYSSRAPIGYCVIASGEISTNQGFKSFVLKGAILPEYIRHYLLASVEYAESKASGTTFKELSGSRAAELSVPLAPIRAQRRIVAKIDELSAKSKRAGDRLDHIPRLVEKYKQAILAGAYTDAQRRSNGLTTLGSLSLEVRNGISKKPSDDPSGFPILRISAVRSMSVNLQDVRYYPETVPPAALLRNGDLLFTRYNGNPNFTAVCGMVKELGCSTAYPDKLIRVRLSELADPKFVELIAAAPQSRDWLAPHIKTAAGQHGISGTDLKKLPIPLPKLSEQQAIARRIETAFTWVNCLASETTCARKLIDHLDQAVLAKAFRGELVPQDPNDEPARVLLERIRAERLVSPEKVRGRAK
jgi:type I restriction enzyme S subunit